MKENQNMCDVNIRREDILQLKANNNNNNNNNNFYRENKKNKININIKIYIDKYYD